MSSLLSPVSRLFYDFLCQRISDEELNREMVPFADSFPIVHSRQSEEGIELSVLLKESMNQSGFPEFIHYWKLVMQSEFLFKFQTQSSFASYWLY